jgi:hypothetical protein
MKFDPVLSRALDVSAVSAPEGIVFAKYPKDALLLRFNIDGINPFDNVIYSEWIAQFSFVNIDKKVLLMHLPDPSAFAS